MSTTEWKLMLVWILISLQSCVAGVDSTNIDVDGTCTADNGEMLSALMDSKASISEPMCANEALCANISIERDNRAPLTFIVRVCGTFVLLLPATPLSQVFMAENEISMQAFSPANPS
jgi:hypothetical protein